MTTSANAEPVRMGDITRSTGVSDQTVRYYERLGLIQSTGRTQGGFRLFRPDTIQRIHMIKLAQSLGFSLEEIQGLLSAVAKADPTCTETQRILEAKVKELDDRIALLTRHRDALVGLRWRCNACEGPCLVPAGLEDVGLPLRGPSGEGRFDGQPA